MAAIEARRRARLMRKIQKLRRETKRLDQLLDAARAKIVQHTVKLQDHETRITTLEP